jgi:hypothetical protein
MERPHGSGRVVERYYYNSSYNDYAPNLISPRGFANMCLLLLNRSCLVRTGLDNTPRALSKSRDA